MKCKKNFLYLYFDKTQYFVFQWILTGAVTSELTCPYAFYLSDEICCQKCFPGTEQIYSFLITISSRDFSQASEVEPSHLLIVISRL